VKSNQPEPPDHNQSLFFEEEGFWEEDDELDETALDLDLDLDKDDLPVGINFLHEAHEAINKLTQKTHTRARIDRRPRRADTWQ
jgi:hypothetical protein